MTKKTSSQQSTGRKAAAAGLTAGLTAGLLGGAAAGMVFGIPGISGAASPAVVQQSDEDTEVEDTEVEDTEVEDTGTEDSATDGTEWSEAATERLREALEPLVEDGTLESDQADAVAEFLVDEGAGRLGKGGPTGHFDRGVGGHFGVSEVLEEELEMSTEEIRDALAEGGTLADLTDDPEALIDALVAEAESHLDEAVADGKLTEDEATERTADLVERVTDMVNGEMPDRRDVPGRGDPGDHGGFPGRFDDSPDEEG